jgi:hypothetical protein
LKGRPRRPLAPGGEATMALARRWMAAVIASVGMAVLLLACEPTVKVEAPKEPITINLNIKLDADVRLRLEESAQKDIKNNPGVF